jgi:hypothetical protein
MSPPKKEKVPALLDVDARIAAKEGFIETKPHGHGAVQWASRRL